MLRNIFILLTVLLVGCESTPVTDASSIQTKSVLKQDFVLPANVSVAIYVDKGKPESNRINFYLITHEAQPASAADTAWAALI